MQYKKARMNQKGKKGKIERIGPNLQAQAQDYINMFSKLLSKFLPNKLPPIMINMIDVVNQEVKIKFEITLPNYEVYMKNAVMDIRDETKLRQA